MVERAHRKQGRLYHKTMPHRSLPCRQTTRFHTWDRRLVFFHGSTRFEPLVIDMVKWTCLKYLSTRTRRTGSDTPQCPFADISAPNICTRCVPRVGFLIRARASHSEADFPEPGVRFPLSGMYPWSGSLWCIKYPKEIRHVTRSWVMRVR